MGKTLITKKVKALKRAAINIFCLMCFFLGKSGEVLFICFFWQFKKISKWLCTMKVHLTFCVFVLMSKAKSLLLYILMHKVTSFLSLFFPQGLASYQWWISDMHAVTRQFNQGKSILEWLHDLNSGTARACSKAPVSSSLIGSAPFLNQHCEL